MLQRGSLTSSAKQSLLCFRRTSKLQFSSDKYECESIELTAFYCVFTIRRLAVCSTKHPLTCSDVSLLWYDCLTALRHFYTHHDLQFLYASDVLNGKNQCTLLFKLRKKYRMQEASSKNATDISYAT